MSRNKTERRVLTYVIKDTDTERVYNNNLITRTINGASKEVRLCHNRISIDKIIKQQPVEVIW